jgi:hypothetical protein
MQPSSKSRTDIGITQKIVEARITVDGKVNKHAKIYKYLGCNIPYINSMDTEFKLNKDHFCGNKQNRLGDFLM